LYLEWYRAAGKAQDVASFALNILIGESSKYIQIHQTVSPYLTNKCELKNGNICVNVWSFQTKL